MLKDYRLYFLKKRSCIPVHVDTFKILALHWFTFIYSWIPLFTHNCVQLNSLIHCIWLTHKNIFSSQKLKSSCHKQTRTSRFSSLHGQRKRGVYHFSLEELRNIQHIFRTWLELESPFNYMVLINKTLI